MSKPRYVVFSGFLGAGKTTTMIALGKYINDGRGKAAIIANDLGGRNLVDGDFTRTTGIETAEFVNDCICYQNADLVSRLEQLVDGGATFIMSDIPGCGIGAYDHVYITTEKEHADDFDFMPFTAVVDPERLRMIMPEHADIYPEELHFIVDAQIKEADLILLNKIDTIDEATLAADLDFLSTTYPEKKILTISARTGEGIPELGEYLLSTLSPVEYTEIGYGTEAFMAAEKEMCWYNNRTFLTQREDKDVDFNAVFDDLFKSIEKSLKEQGGNIGHLKLFAQGEGDDFTKISMIGVGYPIEAERRLDREYAAISFVINGRGVCSSDMMSDVVADGIDDICQKHNLKAKNFFLESFGMMEEGRGNGARASRID